MKDKHIFKRAVGSEIAEKAMTGGGQLSGLLLCGIFGRHPAEIKAILSVAYWENCDTLCQHNCCIPAMLRKENSSLLTLTF